MNRALALPEEGDSLAVGVRNYATLFARRKTTILVALAGFLALTVVITALTPRTYEATATLLIGDVPKVETASSTAPGTPPLAAMGSPNLDTHVQLLMGSAVAADTADYLRRHGRALAHRGGCSRSHSRESRARHAAHPRDRAGAYQRRCGAVGQRGRRAPTSRAITGGRAAPRKARAAICSSNSPTRRRRWRRRRRRCRAYRESTGTITADAAASDLVGQAANLRGEADKAAAELAQAQAQESTLRTQLARTNTTISSGQVRDDGIIQKLRDKLADLESRKLEAQAKYYGSLPRAGGAAGRSDRGGEEAVGRGGAPLGPGRQR